MTFKAEILYKYKSEELYQACIEVFDALPLAALITGSDVGDCLAVHGGIGPDLYLVSQIEQIDRFCEPPMCGIMADILWSDPLEPPNFRNRSAFAENGSDVVIEEDSDEGDSDEGADGLNGNTGSGYDDPLLKKRIIEWQRTTFVNNTIRKTSYQFGFAAIAPFLKRNRLACVIRAHQVVGEGAKEHFFMTQQEFPMVVTVFTAPNYCDMYGNKGAVLKILDDDFEYHQFDAVSHPFHLPNFVVVLGFSVPYIMESLVSILANLVVAIKEENASNTDPNKTERDKKLSEKMLQMRHRLREHEQKRKEVTQQFLLVDHPNFAKFERAVEMDAKN